MKQNSAYDVRSSWESEKFSPLIKFQCLLMHVHNSVEFEIRIFNENKYFAMNFPESWVFEI